MAFSFELFRDVAKIPLYTAYLTKYNYIVDGGDSCNVV